VLTLNPSRLERLRELVASHAGAFRRRDQARWAALYLLGLQEAEGRRTVEGVARALVHCGEVGPLGLTHDLPQGLGHFLSQSPWDEGTLWRRFAERLAGSPGEREGLFVLEEFPFVKQGRHSVGVHRQHSHTLGRKANCQIAIGLYHVGVTAELIGLRLYLPRAWRRDEERLEAAGVPVAQREALDRWSIGRELLETARQAGLASRRLAAGQGWHWGQEGDEGESAWTARGYTLTPLGGREADEVRRTRDRLLELGLGHFEGRSWRGFHHHVCLVTLANWAERRATGR
jgi:SRSO17 transposase